MEGVRVSVGLLRDGQPSDNGATGGTALYMAYVAILSGQHDCVLSLGFDKMYRGPLKENFPDRTSPVKRFLERLDDIDG